MRERTKASFTVLLVLVALVLPATTVRAGTPESPPSIDLTFLVDFVVETIEAVWTAISPASESTEEPAEFGGAVEPVGNESAEADEPIVEFGGQIEPVG